jgi:hypothetical protein
MESILRGEELKQQTRKNAKIAIGERFEHLKLENKI